MHRLLILLFVGLLAMRGMAQESPTPVDLVPRLAPPSEPAPEAAEAEGEPDPAAKTAAALERLNLRARVAQLMLVTMQGQFAPQVDDMALLQEYTPGGVVIRQMLKPTIAASYVMKVRGIEAKTGIPLLVGANLYEMARRDRGAQSTFAQFPTLLSLAAADDSDATRATAALVAENMKVMGFNLYLGPSLELAPTLPNVKGSIDSFGSDPAFASQAGWIFCETLQAQGIIPVPWGFPGGGANRSGKKPAVLLTPRALAMQQDLRPYVHAVTQETPFIHVGPTFAPTLDDTSRPACVSPVIIGGLLRGELDYKGIVIAGPMDGQAVSDLYDPADAAIRALQSGADMIYLEGSTTMAMRVVDKVTTAVEQGVLGRARIDESLRRLLQFKQAWASGARQAVTERATEKLTPGRSERNAVYEIERKAITLVQNRNGVLPLTKQKSFPVGVTGVVGVEVLGKALEKHMKPISQQVITTARHAGEIHDFEINRITAHISGIKTIVVILTDSLRPQGQRELIEALKKAGKNVVAIVLGYPSTLPHLAAADAILCAYCDAATYDATLLAMADTLAGQGAISLAEAEADARVKVGETRLFNLGDVLRVPSGRLPVTISEAYPAGLAVRYTAGEAVKKAEWDFGDGTRSKEFRASHTFKSGGRYPVKLTVHDTLGGTAERTYYVVAE